jgi:pilus assembly protein Flp/PilA
MDKFMNTLRSFIRDEEGAQIIEYALIVAVVSLGLILLLVGATGIDFGAWITKVNLCLTTGTC